MKSCYMKLTKQIQNMISNEIHAYYATHVGNLVN